MFEEGVGEAYELRWNITSVELADEKNSISLSLNV